MKRRIAASAGHSNVPGQDMGAQGNGIIEGNETVVLRNLIVQEFRNRKEPISVDPDSNVTFKTVALFKQYFGKEDILLDIHFNASSNPKATGCEVLVPAYMDIQERDLATNLVAAVSGVLNISNRGVKTELQSARKKLLWMSIPAITVLLEVCFISNPSDVSKYNAHKEELAKVITNILLVHKYK